MIVLLVEEDNEITKEYLYVSNLEISDTWYSFFWGEKGYTIRNQSLDNNLELIILDDGTAYQNLSIDAIKALSKPLSNYQVKSTEQIVSDLQSKMTDLEDKKTLTGSGSPTSIPIFIGQQYIDTINKKIYIATGTTVNADWQLIN
jgi:hypothetical protein